MSEIKLKPCPFCGSENVKLMSNEGEDIFPQVVDCVDDLGSTFCYVHCYGCDTEFISNSDIAKDVVEAWNRRSGE